MPMWRGHPFCFHSSDTTYEACCEHMDLSTIWVADRKHNVHGCWEGIYDASLCCFDVAAHLPAVECEELVPPDVPFERFWSDVKTNLTNYLGDNESYASSFDGWSILDYTQMPAFGRCPLGALALRLALVVSTLPEAVNMYHFAAEMATLKAVPWRLLIRSSWGFLILNMLQKISEHICSLPPDKLLFHSPCEGESFRGVESYQQVLAHAAMTEVDVSMERTAEGVRIERRISVLSLWSAALGNTSVSWDWTSELLMQLAMIALSKAFVESGPDAALTRDVLLHIANQLFRNPAIQTLGHAARTWRYMWGTMRLLHRRVTEPDEVESLSGKGLDYVTRGRLQQPGMFNQAGPPIWLSRAMLEQSGAGMAATPQGLPLDLAKQLVGVDVAYPGIHKLCGDVPLVRHPDTRESGRQLSVVILGVTARSWASASRHFTNRGYTVEMNLYIINERSENFCRHDPKDPLHQYACEQDIYGQFSEFVCGFKTSHSKQAKHWVAASVHSSLNWMRPFSPNLVECALPQDFDLGDVQHFTVVLREALGYWKEDVEVPVCRNGIASTNPSAAICSRPLFRMDSSRAGWILRDWLRYHFLLGFDHVVLYDIDGTLRPWVEELVDIGLVSYFPKVYSNMTRVAVASAKMLEEENGLWGHEFLFDHCLFYLRTLGASWGVTIQAPDKYLVGPAGKHTLADARARWEAREQVNLIYLRDRRFRGLASWPSIQSQSPAMLRFPLYEHNVEKDGAKAPWVAAFRPNYILHVQGHTARPRPGRLRDVTAGEAEDVLRVNHYLEVFGAAGHWREVGSVCETGNGSVFDEDILWALPCMHCWRRVDQQALGGHELHPGLPLFSDRCQHWPDSTADFFKTLTTSMALL